MCSRFLQLTTSVLGWMTGCLVLASTFAARDLSAQDVGGFRTRLNLAGKFVALGNRQQAEGELAQAIASYNRALKLVAGMQTTGASKWSRAGWMMPLRNLTRP